MTDKSTASAFLERLACPDRPQLDGAVLVVVAHPDDETLGCGALLKRLGDLTILHVTDGAPRNGADASRHGFQTPRAYAAARRREVEAALAAGGIADARLLTLDVVDQGVAFALAELTRRLVGLMTETHVVLTHALEGGHPDHDGTAVAVRAAARLLCGRAPAIIEMPFYRPGPDGDGGWHRQDFDDARGATIVHLTEVERRRKLAMLAAHATQRDTLAAFGAAHESFRPARPVEAAGVLGGGPALYDRCSWGVTSTEFEALSRAALQELGLVGPWL